MKNKILCFFPLIFILFSCKKSSDCENCILNIVDDSGKIVSVYTKDNYTQISPNDSWCKFLTNSENTIFRDVYGTPYGKGKKTCN